MKVYGFDLLPWPHLDAPSYYPDPNALFIRCRVNGELRQDGDTRDMILAVPELIAWISRVMSLEPGDVIATGTPKGVGPIAAGDRIAVEIERLGTLEVGVVAA